MRYTQHYSSKQTTQSEPIPGSSQVPNSAGGYAWPVDDWVRLDRFLILGSEGGSYYATERTLTRENAEAVERCLKANGPRAVKRIVEISDKGRAPKNDPAIFALALAAKTGDDVTRKAALAALPYVCRTGTHVFQFAEALQAFGGWGRGTRRAIGQWYCARSADNLAHQLVKYQQRNGWSHRDLLRLSHPKAPTPAHNELFAWATKGTAPEASKLVEGFLRTRGAKPDEVPRLVREYGLTREMVPTEALTRADVWEALLERMQMTAMIRNLATMTRVGLLKPMSATVTTVMERLVDAEKLRKARVHPVAILSALLTYAAGRGTRGQHTWQPVTGIVDALDAAFYASFGNVDPANKRTLLALDVSGSMGWGCIAGISGFTPLIGTAAMALITAATEKSHAFVAFTAAGRMFGSDLGNGIAPVTISPNRRLDDVCRGMAKIPMGGTDCALPMLWAQLEKVEVDTFVVYTDSETWAGAIHPSQALRNYRERTGIPAKLVVVGMVSNGFTIADPNDAGMLDVVGFDTATPQVISQFSAGT